MRTLGTLFSSSERVVELLCVNQRAIFASDQHEFLPIVLMLG